jgi:hypothetical protein
MQLCGASCTSRLATTSMQVVRLPVSFMNAFQARLIAAVHEMDVDQLSNTAESWRPLMSVTARGWLPDGHALAAAAAARVAAMLPSLAEPWDALRAARAARHLRQAAGGGRAPWNGPLANAARTYVATREESAGKRVAKHLVKLAGIAGARSQAVAGGAKNPVVKQLSRVNGDSDPSGSAGGNRSDTGV